VIARIMGEGQYRLSDAVRERVNAVDNAIVQAVDDDDEDAFHVAFEELLELVRSEGEAVDDDEIESSDVIVPPADTSFVEAAKEFTGDGLIPD
jgi:hypothetical protein